MDPAAVAALEAGEARAWLDIYAAMPESLRTGLGAEAAVTAYATVLRMRGIDYEDFNRALGLGVHTRASRQDIEQIIDGYQSIGVKQFLLHVAPAGQQEELRAWMKDLGLVPKRSWVKVFRRREEPHDIQTDFVIREATAAEAHHVGEVSCAGFGMPVQLAPWIAALVGRPNWRHFLAWENETPVAAGSMFLHGNLAWLGLASTRPGKRRRGGQGAIMTARIRAALAAGAEWMCTEAAEDLPHKPNPSFHNMLRAGFSLAYVRENYGLKEQV